MPATEQETTMIDTKAITDALNYLHSLVLHDDERPEGYDTTPARAALAALLAERDKLRAALRAATDYDEAVKAFVYLCSCPTVGQPAGTRLAHEAQLFRAARSKALA
jgi:hypothetical protein